MSNKVAIMYSGGLDSLIGYHYAISLGLDPICINVGFGHDYDTKEQTSIKSLGSWSPTIHRLNIEGLHDLIRTRLSNQIIPSRNVLLGVIGSMVAPRVWLHALDGEQNGKEHDKSERFFEDTTKLLTFTNEFFQPQSIVETPFGHLSKGETIALGLKIGIPLEIMFETSSCYNANQKKCGQCLTCVKRYLAFAENGIIEPGYDANPLDSDYFKELCVEIPKAISNNDYSRFTKKRADAFMEVVKTFGISL